MNAPAYRLDGRPVDAAAFYAAACDPRRSAVVEACAGAGKTWMLVSRILRALLDGAEPEQVLAITFTRKAAGEMRQRLDQWLSELGDGASDEAARADALAQRGLDAAAAAALAPTLGGLQRRLLARARAVEIRTFHGWFAQLLAQAPLELLQGLGLAAAPALVEDREPLRAELMQAFHRAVEGDARLRDDYLVLTRRHRRHSLQRWFDAAWQRRAEVEAAAEAGTLDASVPPASAVFADVAPDTDPAEALRDPAFREALQALAAALQARGKVRSDEAAARLVQALESTDVRQAFALARQALFTDSGTPRKQLGDPPGLAEAADRLQALAERVQQQDAHDDHVRMARLARALLGAYAELKRRRALVDMDDLEALARAALADGEVAAWMQARLGQRLRHLLIDEFQDTSPVQWQALRGWLDGYAGAGGGQDLSVFIVGDPKQSIYRFRRAEPRVFAAAREFVQQALGGQALACDHTRRSAQAVIDAVNAVFGAAGAQGGWDGFRPHTTASAEAGQVLRLPLPQASSAEGDASDEASGDVPAAWRDTLTEPRRSPTLARHRPEAEQVAAAVARLLGRGVPTGEVMVLARRRAALAVVGDALAEQGVPYTVPEALGLATSAEAQDLLAVLDVLASPGHDLSLARCLRSPLFGAPDDALLWLSLHARRDACRWREALHRHGPRSRWPELVRAEALLAGWARAAPTLPPHDLLERIVHEGDLRARLAAAVPPAARRGARQAVDALLAAALEVDQGRYLTPYRFVRAMRRQDLGMRLSAPPDAVRLLTVHGAKGLEAQWVFVVDSDPTPRRAESATLLVDWPVNARAPQRVAFVARESAPPPSLAALVLAEQVERAREELNGLYVAMTRAEQGLVFSATPPRHGQVGSWWQRVQAVAVESADLAGHAAAPGATSGGAAHADVEVPTLPVLARQPPAGPATASLHGVDDDADGARVRLGRAVHRLLEWIGQPGQPLPREEWPAAAVAAAAWAGAEGGADEVLANACRIVDSPDCARFFSGAALRWAGNELPMAGEGRVLRLDRLVRLEADGRRAWWVLDYKLAERPETLAAARDQLQGYVQALRLAQPGDEVGAGFITGEGRWVPLEDPASAM